MYLNFKNYSVEYDEQRHCFSCSYAAAGEAEARPFITDARPSVRSYQGEAIALGDYGKIEVKRPVALGSQSLSVLYSDGPAAVPSVELHFTIDSGSLHLRTFARAIVHIDGDIHWGEDPEHATWGIRMTTDDPHLRTACGPAFSRHDHALFDRLSDRALEFKATDQFTVFYDWKAATYRFVFASGLDYGRNFSFKIHEEFYRRKFNIPYAPINKSHGFTTPPVGWMTWYAVQFKACEQRVLENARLLAATFGQYTDRLCLWVDWEWNHSDFTGLGETGVDTFTPRKDAYPHGLDFVAQEIGKLGLIPALWVGATNDGQRNHLLHKHPDWILAQKPEWCGQFWVDPSHPDVAGTYIPAVFRQIRDWGYQAIKWDCLPATFDMGDAFHAQFHNPKLSTDAAMRQLVQAARATVGPDFFLLSCAGATERDITFAMDLFDMARIGGDIFGWEEFIVNSVDRVLHFYPWHNVVFYVDADNLVLRREFNTLAQARSRVSFYGLAGLPVTLGDALPELDEARIDLLKRLMPVADIHPVDVQPKVRGNDYALTNLAVCKPFGTWNVIGVLNPKDEPLTLTLSLDADLQIDTRHGRCHAVYSFWDGQFLGVHGDVLTIEVPPMDSAVLRITPVDSHPQVISTSRHITQGAIDLVSLAWNGKTNRLSGQSEVVAGDAYRLSVYLPDGYTFAALSLPAGCTRAVAPVNSQLLTVDITSRKSRRVTWELSFWRRHLGGVPVANGESLGRGPVLGTATDSQLV